LAWTVEFLLTAQQQIKKFDPTTQQRITSYFRNRIMSAEDPRRLGKMLQGDKGGLWRFRIGDYRAICKISHR